jgi:hypothetical protein
MLSLTIGEILYSSSGPLSSEDQKRIFELLTDKMKPRRKQSLGNSLHVMYEYILKKIIDQKEETAVVVFDLIKRIMDDPEIAEVVKYEAKRASNIGNFFFERRDSTEIYYSVFSAELAVEVFLDIVKNGFTLHYEIYQYVSNDVKALILL